VLVGDLVISVCIQDPCDNLIDPPGASYVVAHDKRTGREVWKTTRITGATRYAADAYVTPILRKANNRTELVVAGGEWLDAYEPATGKRLWYVPDLTGKELARSPVASHGMIYTAQGLDRALLAIRPGGDGQRPQEEVSWTFGNVAWDVPSPVVWDERLFLVNNMGIACCLNALTGEVLWKQRLRGNHRASPMAADGRIYFLNTSGLTTVVSASATFEELATNQTDDQTYASPAVSDGKLFIRGRKWLYCIGP
jgi:outer membrane protein assembly factor BamB